MTPVYNYCPLCQTALKHQHFEGKRRAVCPSCQWVHYINPLPVAVGVVRNEDNELLLIRRGIPPSVGAWALPGGFVEANEHPEKAAVREIFEEVGLRASVKGLIGVFMRRPQMYGSIVVMGYEMVVKKRKITCSHEVLEAGFFPVDNTPRIAFKIHRDMVNSVYNIKGT